MTMNKIIIYFSLLKHNKHIAEEMAKNENCNVLEFAPGSFFRAFQFFFGKKKLAEKAKKINIENYDEITICGPIWGGRPAPAVNALLENLNYKNKKLSCHFTYTKDYSDSENFVKDLIIKNSGQIKEITFNNISKQ